MASKVSPETQLRRFLYTSMEQPRYIAGNPELYNYYAPEKLKSVVDILKGSNPEKLLNIIQIVNSENILPRRETLFFALAVAILSDSSYSFRHQAYQTVLQIIKNDKDLFEFIKFFTKIRKTFPSGLNKLISTYYLSKDPFELAKDVAKSNGYHGWTHKDLIKLSHCKSTTVMTTAILAYILFDIKKCKEIAHDDNDAKVIVEYFEKLQKLKRTENEAEVVSLIKELEVSINRIPTNFLKSAAVWETVISELSIQDLITSLPKLYRKGFLKQGNPVHDRTVDILSGCEKIKDSQIHPVNVFIGLKDFEKGGKPKDPKLVSFLESSAENAQAKKELNPEHQKPDFTLVKCPTVISALHKTLMYSYQNTPTTGKRYMITIDVSVKMDEKCLHNRNITCLEAAAIVALSILKAEKQVVISVFNGTSVTPISIEKSISVGQFIKKLKETDTPYNVPSAIFEWALSKKKQIDIFIILNYHLGLFPKDRPKEKPLESLSKYQKAMNLPHAKLVTHSLGVHHLHLADGSRNALDLCGFDNGIPKVLEAFTKGLF